MRVRLLPYRPLLAIWALTFSLNCGLVYLILRGQAGLVAYLGALAGTTATSLATQAVMRTLPPRSHRLSRQRVRALSSLALTLGEAVAREDAIPENRGHRVYPIQLKEALGDHLDHESGQVGQAAAAAFTELVQAGAMIDRRQSHDRWLAYSSHPKAGALLAAERERRQGRPLGRRSRLGPLAG